MTLNLTALRPWLKKRGYDGLYHPGACACDLSDLASCGEDHSDCKPGYKTAGCQDWCGLGCAWHIGERKEVKR